MDYRFAPGSSFAGYTIDAPIGSGCAGETYRARRAGTRINVALKIAWPELAAVQGFAFEMQRQAKILQRFRHPGLCTMLDSGISKGLPFWVSEYVPGPRGEPCTLKDYLADRVARGKMIEEDEVFIIAQELIEPLTALHGFRDREECPNGLALGDLRPVNILLDADTKFRLCDLGLSALVRATTASFPGSKGIGVGCMSPEVRAGQPPTPRSDVYSLGAILYELLTGEKFSANAQPPSMVRKGIKPGWDEFLLKSCLAENPDERIPDMKALKAGLEDVEKSKRPKTVIVAKAANTEDDAIPVILEAQEPVARPRTMYLKKPSAEPEPAAAAPARPKTITIRKPGAVPAAVAQAETIAFQKPVPKKSDPPAAKPETKNRAGLWIGLGLAATLAIGGGLAWYFSGKKSQTSASTNAAPAIAKATSTATTIAGQSFKLASAEIEMKWIAPATALLGTDEAEQKTIAAALPVAEAHTIGYEKPKEAALSNGFWIADTETTVGLWKKFTAANPGFKTTAEKKGAADTIRTNGEFAAVNGVNWSNPLPGIATADTWPVTCVTPADIQIFCAWLTNRERDAGRISPEYAFRLPTEIEWEHACRGGAKTRTLYAWGSDPALGEGRINAAGAEFTQKFPDTAKYNFTWSDPHLFLAPVASSGEKGRNELGLSDMLGNVWECVTRGPLTKRDHGWRGGSFAEGATIVRCASSRSRYTDKPSANAGFRIALSK